MKQNLNTAFLGPNSYPAVVGSIYDALNEAVCDTTAGNELVREAIQKMNESTTPVLDLKDFTTNAEKVAPNDTKLMDVIDFARKQVKGGDLNCLINIAKEEHIQEQSRTGMPTPEATIKNWEEIMNKPSSVIEEGIKNGLFKGLDSKLYMELENIISEDGKNKSKNKVVAPQDHHEGNVLNESATLLSPTGNIAIYAPIGVRMEDPKNNRILMLTENAVLTYDRENETFFSLNESEYKDLNIPDRHRRLMTALQTLPFDAEKQVFSLNESWDFGLSLNDNGGVVLSRNGKSTEMKSEDVPNFLMESIDIYAGENSNKKFDRVRFAADADNFVMLMENHDRLQRLDKLRTIRNLEDGKYIMVDTRTEMVPVFITSSEGPKLFESYEELTREGMSVLNESVEAIFTPHLQREHAFYKNQKEIIRTLNESQHEINHLIKKTTKLRDMADEDSPAMDLLNEQDAKLRGGLEKNMKALDRVVNMATPYGMSLNEAVQSITVTDFSEYISTTPLTPIKDVLTGTKIAEFVARLGNTGMVHALVSDDMSNYLLCYQDANTANWVIDLWTPIDGYSEEFQQNNFAGREEALGYVENISEGVAAALKSEQALAKAA
jgi:hypothetical protein